MKIKQHFPSSYLVWDTETTGLDPATCKVIEIAAIRVKDSVVVDRWSSLLNWGLPIPEQASVIHGITKQMIDEAGPFTDPKAVLHTFLDMLHAAGNVSVTHNGSRFDIPFLMHAFGAVGISPGGMWDRFHIDTAALYKGEKLDASRGWFEDQDSFYSRVLNVRAPIKYNVGVCCDELGIDRSQVVQHRALGDCELTNEIYKKLCL